jgi:MerR family transcriptional regulator, copper efflux regulator
MLRYRESLGLLPAVRQRGAAPAGEPHRQFSEQDLDAVAFALNIERRYDISPAALAFGLRVLSEPGPRADVAELGRRIGRVRPAAVRALDFEQERALRLLNMPRRPR